MSDFERDYEIAYHWSPSTRRDAIEREGLRIGSEPSVNGVEDDHRNGWVSVSPTPSQAWWLSAGALHIGGFGSEAPIWDLYEVDIADLSVERRQGDYPEFYVHENVASERVTRVAIRKFGAWPDIQHNDSRYTNHGCRCDDCKADHAAVKRARGARKRP